MMARWRQRVHVRQSVKANGQVVVIFSVAVAVAVFVVADAHKQVSSASAAHEGENIRAVASLGGIEYTQQMEIII